ncbi:MAG TPA: sigma-70 family RNA polymerase sigma factor [Blastocatellia bacterium]
MSEGGNRSTIFGQAALEHVDALYGFAMTLTRNETEAEDLVQETCLLAVRAFGQLRPDSNLKGWLFVLMRNAWLNQLRKTRSGPRFVELDAGEPDRASWFEDSYNDPYALYVKKLERQEVRAAIDSLPRPYREIIVFRDIEGFSYKQIATILGCPTGTVMSRLGRAREKLRRLLADWQAEGVGHEVVRANKV